jgi:hypothetical protein
MPHISIRALQKISGETIGALAGPTAIKSGGRTIGLLIPLKRSDRQHLAEVLAKAERLARKRSRAEDDAALAAMGIDPADSSAPTKRSRKPGQDRPNSPQSTRSASKPAA